MAADTLMALTLLGLFSVAWLTFWVDEKLRRREERRWQEEIESRRNCP